MNGLIGVLVIAIVISVLCSAQVEGKNLNRVQKWQQQQHLWKTRFGGTPKSNWNFDTHTDTNEKPPRRNRYAISRYGSPLSNQHELDLLTGRRIPNGYSNFHYKFNELKSQLRSSAKGHEKKDVIALNQNGVEQYRMKRFAFQDDNDEDDDDDNRGERFGNDLANAPFVFQTDARLKDEDDYSNEGFSDDLADIDFVRDDSNIDFIPIQPGPNQRYITTVEENDPLPHAVIPLQGTSNGRKKNGTRKVQYTLIVHHGAIGEEQNGAANDLTGRGAPFLLAYHCGCWLIWLFRGRM